MFYRLEYEIQQMFISVFCNYQDYTNLESKAKHLSSVNVSCFREKSILRKLQSIG